jgi:hypothetical protein
MNIFSKIIIYPKDISLITGKSYRASWQLLQKIRTHYQKEKHQVVTIQEFCEYMGLKPEEIIRFL